MQLSEGASHKPPEKVTDDYPPNTPRQLAQGNQATQAKRRSNNSWRARSWASESASLSRTSRAVSAVSPDGPAAAPPQEEASCKAPLGGKKRPRSPRSLGLRGLRQGLARGQLAKMHQSARSVRAACWVALIRLGQIEGCVDVDLLYSALSQTVN